MTKKPVFTYTDFDCYVSQTYFVIKPSSSNLNLKYLTALLNSQLFYFWFYHRGKRKGEQLQIDKEPLMRVPIRAISLSEQQPFISVVDRILSSYKDSDYINNPDKQAKVSALEREIDKIVYTLYELTPEEIAIVEEISKGDGG